MKKRTLLALGLGIGGAAASSAVLFLAQRRGRKNQAVAPVDHLIAAPEEISSLAGGLKARIFPLLRSITGTAAYTSPIARVGGETGEFERLRRSQETRNEMVISLVIGFQYTGAFLANLLTRFRPVGFYVIPIRTLTLIGLGALSDLGLLLYLRTDPPYSPLRKHLIMMVQVIFYTITFPPRGAAETEMFSLFFPISVYMLLVIVSGLRYSTGAVIATGVVTALTHILMFGVTAPPKLKAPVIFAALLLLSGATLATSYGVASLMRINRDSSLKESLKRFLAPELVEHVSRDMAILHGKTENRLATVLFTDIRGFTSLNEHMSPEKVVQVLNLFLEEMTAAIMEHNGMLDKYIGDAVMGVFGVPFAREDHAIQALRASLEMRDRLNLLNGRLKEQGLPALSIGIGLHTGNLVVGAIGSSRRLDYTVIGDTVNVASRLESLTRHYPVEILLSDATREALGPSVSLREVATVQVKGREEPVTIWSPE